MSWAVSSDKEARGQAEARADTSAVVPRGRRRGRWAALGIVVVVAAGAVSAWRAGVFSGGSSPDAGYRTLASASAPVRRQDLSAATPEAATLGYAGSYPVRGQGGGTLTWLPSAGQVISQGQVLYKTDNGSPVALLYGSVPDWRALDEGVTGADVSQLNHDLVALGDAGSSDIAAAGWDNYSGATKGGVQKLQAALGASVSGSLSLGQVVFEPEALRVTTLSGSLGGSADGQVLTATSDRHVVTVPLDVAQQSEVKAGDAVTVTLPDGATTQGAVSSVGAVATTSGSGSGAATTIPVQVTLSNPAAVGRLDQAPVTVNIITAIAHNALVVPVGALLAQVKGDGEADGGYAVEAVGAGSARRLVPVTVGIFDDVNGLVQVTGALTPGQRVVVPAT